MDEKIKFLIEYSKIGILKTMEVLDEIEKEELKQKYINIKNSFQEDKALKKKFNQEKPSAMKKWFSGIGDRNKEYYKNHRDIL